MKPDPASFDRAATNDLERVRHVTRSLDQFLGLYLVPPGLAVILVGAANGLPTTALNTWLMLAAPVVGVASWLAVRSHYLRVVGRVHRRTTRRELIGAVLAAGLLLVGAIADTVLDSPIALTLVALALGFWLGTIPCGGRRQEFAAGLAIASVLVSSAWWGADAAGGLTSIAMGLAFVAAGLASHATLDEALSPVGAGQR